MSTARSVSRSKPTTWSLLTWWVARKRAKLRVCPARIWAGPHSAALGSHQLGVVAEDGLYDVTVEGVVVDRGEVAGEQFAQHGAVLEWVLGGHGCSRIIAVRARAMASRSSAVSWAMA